MYIYIYIKWIYFNREKLTADSVAKDTNQATGDVRSKYQEVTGCKVASKVKTLVLCSSGRLGLLFSRLGEHTIIGGDSKLPSAKGNVCTQCVSVSWFDLSPRGSAPKVGLGWSRSQRKDTNCADWSAAAVAPDIAFALVKRCE